VFIGWLFIGVFDKVGGMVRRREGVDFIKWV
jgi:hypothetical protein